MIDPDLFDPILALVMSLIPLFICVGFAFALARGNDPR